ncbi:unnamed protein product [Symbiodinium sp. CCMP2592]|nr:unnamed protein product [Symbiodinium sp. CCMP2592]
MAHRSDFSLAICCTVTVRAWCLPCTANCKHTTTARRCLCSTRTRTARFRHRAARPYCRSLDLQNLASIAAASLLTSGTLAAARSRRGSFGFVLSPTSK